MALFFGIALLVMSIFLILIIFMIAKQTDNGDIIPSTMSGAFAMLFFIVGIALINEYRLPSITPIDVYRGKTTLEITYRDSIAIDSTVVWKEEIK